LVQQDRTSKIDCVACMQVAHYPANYNVDNVLTVAATGITKKQVPSCA
jgi:hypothetical protein